MFSVARGSSRATHGTQCRTRGPIATILACGMCVLCNILSNMRIQYVYEVNGQFVQFVQCSAHPVLHAVGHIDIFVQAIGVASAAGAGGHVNVVHEVICSRAPFGCA